MSIDDYLDGLLSGSSEPSRKAIMKLTRLIENFGSIMVKSTERMEDYINTLDTRISTIEQSLGIVSQRLIVGKGARAQAPTAAAPTAAAPTAAAPTAAAPAGAPNLSAAPAGAPNLSAAPSLDGGGANIPAPSMPNGSGSGVSNDDLMKAAANLQKAPEQPAPGDPGAPGAAPVFSPFGVSATDIQDVRSGLTKVDPDEHRKERAASTAGGSMPASMVLNAEVKEALQKRKSKSEDDDEDDFVPAQAAPASPQKSTKQMKEALQGELRDAFSSLLESDTQDEEE
ncbi:MAG: hypothetical protein H7645_07355 [Candidatus Heimdallarchaeota archaeon]|nr:hypothetical protein [Candidatus Heimdallarchaeota archaeon]MCK4770141.1 hypothetical protein [Candidatus Heimdallarchaeota archaeon]